jgi:hypothetical protein
LLFNCHVGTLRAVKGFALLIKQIQTRGKLKDSLPDFSDTGNGAPAGKNKLSPKQIRRGVYALCLFPIDFKTEQ